MKTLIPGDRAHSRILETPLFACFLRGLSNTSSGPLAQGKRAGQKRAAFWRVQGFPNLVLARTAKAAKHQRAQARAADEEFRRYVDRRLNELATNLQGLFRR
jgi:hypothetical protein